MDSWESLRDSLVLSVRDRAGEFLKKHADAEAFVLERAERVAKLLVEYAVNSGDRRLHAAQDLKIVRQTIENRLSTIALDAEAGSKSLFVQIVTTAFDVVIRALPSIISLL